VDFHGFSFTSWDAIPPTAYIQAMNRMSEMSEVLHPLSMGTTTVVGLPGAAIAKRIISISKRFLPKSLQEAQLCVGNRKTQAIVLCPYIMNKVPGGPDAVPLFLGGSCPVSGTALESGRGQDVAEPSASEEAVPSVGQLDKFEAMLGESSDVEAAAKAALEVEPVG